MIMFLCFAPQLEALIGTTTLVLLYLITGESGEKSSIMSISNGRILLMLATTTTHYDYYYYYC